MDIFKESD